MKRTLLGLSLVLAIALSGCSNMSDLNTFSMPDILPKQAPMKVYTANICTVQYGVRSCHLGYVDKNGNEVYPQTFQTGITHHQGYSRWGGYAGGSVPYGYRFQLGHSIPLSHDPYHSRVWHQKRYPLILPSTHR